MKTANCVVSIFAVLTVAAPSPLWAQNNDSHVHLIVSRDAGGSINKESKRAIRLLSAMAKENGHVRVWVTLDMPFDPFLVEVSKQSAAAQQARLDDVFDDVLSSLLNSGEAWYVDGERVYMGASLSLMVTDTGLSRLVDDRRVGQLVGVQER